MPKKVGGLQQLLMEELQDLFDAERQLVRSLPKMAKSCSDEELGNALRQHLEVTKEQVQRLEQVFQTLDMRARSRPCKGMQGIVQEGQEMLAEELQEGILDSAITGSARKVEHYEMMGYESARSIAQRLGMKDAASLLEQTLKEEMEADKQLAQISKRLVKNVPSSRAETREGPSGRQSPRGGRAESRSRHTSSRRSGGSSRTRPAASTSQTGHSAQPLTDHEEIRHWAEERGARPTCVRGTGGKGDTGMIRLDFPGYSGEESLQEISWDEWFGKFDQNSLALIVQETTAGGQKSNFNKIVSRETMERRPRTRSAH